MDLEKVALEAVKIKIQEIFDKITVNTEMEGKDIVIRIKLADEIMNIEEPKFYGKGIPEIIREANKGLDKEAQAAADELLGTQPFISQE